MYSSLVNTLKEQKKSLIFLCWQGHNRHTMPSMVKLYFLNPKQTE